MTLKFTYHKRGLTFVHEKIIIYLLECKLKALNGGEKGKETV